MRRLLLAIALVLTVAPAAGAAEDDGDRPPRRALVVGISDYVAPTVDTVGGAGDAEDVREALHRAGFVPEDVRVLTDGAATAQAIREGLRWLGDASTDTTFSVFHYSGHVKQLGGDLDGDGEALDEYLWAHDNRFVADSELSAWIRRIRGRVWVDLSGCEASGLDDGINAPNRLVTVSSGETEKSYEHPEWRNSIFTGLLVDQGMLQGRADSDATGRVSIQEAFALAAREAPAITAHQRSGPQHPEMRGGGDRAWYLEPEPAAEARPGPRLCYFICLNR